MSIKNPLPGHQYGRSEPGYWYPRPDPPRRRRDPRRMRNLLGGLTAVLVIVVAVDWSNFHHQKLPGWMSGSALASPSYRNFPLAPPPPAVSTTTAVPAPAGYRGALAGDRIAGSSGSVSVGGLAVTANGWTTTSPGSGQQLLCVNASIANRNAVEAAYGSTDWSLQSPTGDVHTPIPAVYQPGEPPSLTDGRLIPGGSTSGRLCFSDPGIAGTYVVSYQPQVPGAGRGVWLVRLP